LKNIEGVLSMLLKYPLSISTLFYSKNLQIMSEKCKILFVCTINRMRSATAHAIYAEDERFDIQSAGTSTAAKVVISRELLEWADSVVVMEKHHRNTIRKLFPDLYQTKKIVCLYIPDDYDFMQPELIDLLKAKFEDVYRRGLV
jgi:predicted protein tyrosine phosphatase